MEIIAFIIFFKSNTGLISANFQNLLLPISSGYATRNFSDENYRLYSSHRQIYFINSYIATTVNLWNGLLIL
jgi:hypothetical protein